MEIWVKKIYNGNGELVKTIILDSYIQKVENPIGFIKADIEGAMFDALKGMVKTIRKYRPVLSFAIYHSAEEFFETKYCWMKLPKIWIIQCILILIFLNLCIFMERYYLPIQEN